jgi:hypothetical protein
MPGLADPWLILLRQPEPTIAHNLGFIVHEPGMGVTRAHRQSPVNVKMRGWRRLVKFLLR